MEIHNTDHKLPINFLGSKPVVIDFYADWCGPCHAISPILERLSKKYSDDIDVYKINVDDKETSKIVSLFSIRSIPTVVYIPVNGPHKITTGLVPESMIVANIDDILK